MIGILLHSVDLSRVSPANVFKLAQVMLLQESDPVNRQHLRRDVRNWILTGAKDATTAFIANSMKELNSLQYGNMDAAETDRIANWLVATLQIAAGLKTVEVDGGGEAPVRVWAKAMVDQILDVAQAAFHRPYIPKHKIQTSLQFISAFCDLSEDVKDGDVGASDEFLAAFFDRLQPVVPRIICFLQQQLQEILNSSTDVRVSDVLLYDGLLGKLPVGSDREMDSLTNNLLEISTSLLSDGKNTLDSFVGGVLFNAWSRISRRIGVKVEVALEPNCFGRLLESKMDCPEGFSSESWRSFRDRHILNLWKMAEDQPQLFRSMETGKAVDIMLASLDVVKADSAQHAFACLSRLLKELIASGGETEENSRFIESSFEKMLATVKEFYNDDRFWSLYGVFVNSIFDGTFLTMKDEGVVAQLHLIFAEIVRLSETRVGLVPVLAKACFAAWTNGAETNAEKTLESLIRYADMIHDCLLFGPVHHKFTRNVTDTLEYLVNRHDGCGVKDDDQYVRFSRRDLECGVPPSHATTRVHAVVFVVRLSSSKNRSFFAPFFRRLADLLLTTDSSHRRRGAHFANSYLHRRGHRVWQALTLTQTALKDDADHQDRLLGHCLSALEANLPVSVRYMVEWTIARILCLRLNRVVVEKSRVDEGVKPDVLRALDSFVSAFHALPVKRVGSTSSLVDVIVMVFQGFSSHLLPTTPASCSRQVAVQVFSQIADVVLPLLIPLTTSQHFITRSYAIAGLASVWPLVSENLSREDFDRYRIVDSIVTFNQNKTDGLKKSGEFVEHLFVFNGFHPTMDLSLETLYEVLPRLTDVTDEEWIFPEAFEEASVDGNAGGSDDDGDVVLNDGWVPFRNDITSRISSCAALNLKLKTHHVVEEADEAEARDFDVQKKIIPSAPLVESAFDLVERESGRGSRASDTGLIIIASLVDKIPNLGGLCR